MLSSLYIRAIALWNDPLHRNSYILMASTAVLAGVGFFFWIVVSHFYTTEQVGIGSGLISISGLLMGIASLGFPNALIRYLPRSSRKSDEISMAIALSGIAAVLVSVLFLFISKIWFVQLHSLISTPQSWIFFCISILFGTWQQLTDCIFIALKKNNWIFLENSIFSLAKLGFSLPLAFLLGYGIFMSHFLGMIISTIVSLIVLIRKFDVKFSFKIRSKLLREIGKYTTNSYLVSIISTVPSQILPVLVISRLGAESAAHFFVAQMVINLLMIIPQSSSQVLFSEASEETTPYFELTKKTLRLQTILSSTAVVAIWMFGEVVLSFFGSKYATETLPVLRILSLGVFPVILSYPFSVRLRLYKKLKELLLTAALGTVVILTFSYFGSAYGLIGISLGYVLGQCSILIILFLGYILERKL